MKLTLIAACTALLAAACAMPEQNASVSRQDRTQRDAESAAMRSNSYYRADNGDPGRSIDNSRNPSDSGH